MYNKSMDESEIGTPLKDCPFCGYKAEMYRVGSYRIIRCSNRACRAEQNAYKTTEEAARRWNMRIALIEEAIKNEKE